MRPIGADQTADRQGPPKADVDQQNSPMPANRDGQLSGSPFAGALISGVRGPAGLMLSASAA